MSHAPDKPLKPRQAALAMVGAMAIVGVVDTTVIDIAQVVSIWQFFVVRAAFVIPILMGLAWWRGVSLWPTEWLGASLRSVLVALAMVVYFSAMGFLPMAQALAGLFTAPIFVLLISVFVQKLRIGPWRVLAVVIGFAGVLLVLQPGAEGFHPLMIVPVLAGVFYASGSVITRTMCASENTLTLLIGLFVAQAIFGALGVAFTGGGDDFISRDWTWGMGPIAHWIAAQVVLSILGVGLVIWAYQHGEASQVSVFEYTIFIFGPLCAYLAFGQTVGPWAFLGIGFIALAGIIIGLRSGS